MSERSDPVTTVAGPNPNIMARLAGRAARHPEREAIVEYSRGRARRIGFGELAASAAALAAGLRRAGVRPGDHVLLFVPMSIDLYRAFFACAHAGAAVVFVDAWADRQRLERAVQAAVPRAFIGVPKAHLLRLTSSSVRRIPVHWIAGRRVLRLRRYERRDLAVVEPAERGSAGSREPMNAGPRDYASTDSVQRVSADSPALLTFTTGSTGRPKVVARSHAFLWSQHEAIDRLFGPHPGDRDMPTLPMFVLHNLAAGVTSILPDLKDVRRPADFDPAAVYRQIVTERVVTSSGSPAFYERLVSWCESHGRQLPLQKLYTGGAPVYPPLARRLAAATAGTVHVVYGSTEAEPIASTEAGELVRFAEAETAHIPRAEERVRAADADGRASTAARGRDLPRSDRAGDGIYAGQPVPDVRVRIIRPYDGPIELREDGWEPWLVPAGEVGEIVVAGPHVVGPYHESPEADALHKISDGVQIWHRTGDAARRDADGGLYLMGRISERVRREGTVWWPTPAEMRALRMPGVRHAAYLGVPASASDQNAIVCVELGRGEITDDEAAAFRQILAPIPVDAVRAFKHIPRDPRHASKTDVVKLRQIL